MELEGRKVKVYRNLRNGRFSVLDAKTNRLITYLDSFTLQDAVFHVQPAGQAKVRAKGQRNVHAYVKGYISYSRPRTLLEPIYYNPFVTDTFTVGGWPIFKAKKVFFENQKLYLGEL